MADARLCDAAPYHRRIVLGDGSENETGRTRRSRRVIFGATGLIALGAHALACGGATSPAPQTPSVSAVDSAPQVLSRDGVAVVRAGAQTQWADVIGALDRVRASGTTRFVLEVSGDPSLRSGEMELPRAAQLDEAAVVVVDLDDAAGVSHVAPNDVALRAGARAPFAEVVRAVRLLQSRGASVMFSVAPTSPSPSPSAASPPRPRLAVDGMASCPVPPEADVAKIDDAAVVVEVDVGPSGRASDVRIVSDPGHGVGRAAQACALGAKYEPAHGANGAAIAASVKVRVHFQRPPP